MGAEYLVILEPQPEGVILVRFPDFPEPVTQGADEAETLAVAADCFDEMVSYHLLKRLPIPPATLPGPGGRTVTLPAPIAAKAAPWSSSCALPDAGLSRRPRRGRRGWPG